MQVTFLNLLGQRGCDAYMTVSVSFLESQQHLISLLLVMCEGLDSLSDAVSMMLVRQHHLANPNHLLLCNPAAVILQASMHGVLLCPPDVELLWVHILD